MVDYVTVYRGVQPNSSGSSQTLAGGHTFVQNLRRGHYEMATDEPPHGRLRIAFNALAAGVC